MGSIAARLTLLYHHAADSIIEQRRHTVAILSSCTLVRLPLCTRLPVNCSPVIATSAAAALAATAGLLGCRQDTISPHTASAAPGTAEVASAPRAAVAAAATGSPAVVTRTTSTTAGTAPAVSKLLCRVASPKHARDLASATPAGNEENICATTPCYGQQAIGYTQLLPGGVMLSITNVSLFIHCTATVLGGWHH
jgi:hypothetical protein